MEGEQGGHHFPTRREACAANGPLLTAWLGAKALGFAVCVAAASAQVPLPIAQLVFKGTHNSYACRAGTDSTDGSSIEDPPWMNHPPHMLLDGFGVWSVELDIGVWYEQGTPQLVVSHNTPDTCGIFGSYHNDALNCDIHCTYTPCECWGRYLTNYLIDIHSAACLQYRPVFINFDIHCYTAWSYEDTYAWAKQQTEGIFGPGNVIDLYDYIQSQGGAYPILSGLAGKAVIYLPWPEFSDTSLAIYHWTTNSTLRSPSMDHCTDYANVSNSIATGAQGNLSTQVPYGARVLRLDQYQADWTFDYGVPPNPIVVDSNAQSPWTVSDSVGDGWFCGYTDTNNNLVVTDASIGDVVTNHGTYRFPYKTLTDAVHRASGIVPEDPSPNTLRSGYGWTVLLNPGHYPESVTVPISLVLTNANPSAGLVTIGR